MRQGSWKPVGILLVTLIVTACGGAEPESLHGPPLPTVNLTPTTSSTLPVEIEKKPIAQAPTAEILSGLDFTFPQAGVNQVSAWRPPPYPAPWAVRTTDHFFLSRPIPSGDVNWPNPSYRYGSTLFGEESIHTGIDLGADRETPVLAAGDGEVVWVGFGLYRGVHDPTDPYGLSIAIRQDFGYDGQGLFTIYGHLESAWVWPGQRVEVGEQIGTVGDTGHASGPHLHFEVRLGENRYFATRNPELWLVPAEGWGILAGKVENSFGQGLTEQLIQIRSLETDLRLDVWTYALGTVHPDDTYQENFVVSDLPAGPYEVQIDFAGKSYFVSLFVYPGQTNLLLFEGRAGFTVEPAVEPNSFDAP